MGTVPEGEDEAQTRSRIWAEDEALAGEASVIENRDLIFMRTKSEAEIKADQALFGEPGRVVKGVYILFYTIQPCILDILTRFPSIQPPPAQHFDTQ